ncbi:mCG62199 [Mus musculus]|nr:mCG62199 [Mus musculus]
MDTFRVHACVTWQGYGCQRPTRRSHFSPPCGSQDQLRPPCLNRNHCDFLSEIQKASPEDLEGCSIGKLLSGEGNGVRTLSSKVEITDFTLKQVQDTSPGIPAEPPSMSKMKPDFRTLSKLVSSRAGEMA